jgi:hypothetical protein
MFKFNRYYFLGFIALLLIEIFIALYVNDNFIRPYFGDYLVVILIYCFLMSFLAFSKWKIAFYVLLFAFAVEFLQYIDFITFLGLHDNKLARVVIGTSFAWHDMLAYFFGYLSIVGFEYFAKRKN